MKMTDECADRLYELFREKMHDVYRKNFKSDIFGNKMIPEFNAWQAYLRESLDLDVVDAGHGDKNEVFKDRSNNVFVKIMNPSNGTTHGYEYILVPAELATKILVLGALPDEV